MYLTKETNLMIKSKFILLCLLWVQMLSSQSYDNSLVFTRHTAAVKSVAFSPDGSLLATGSEDKTICIWNTKTGELVTTIGDNFFPAIALKFRSNDELFIASGPDIKLIDFSGKIIRTYTGKTVHIWSIDYNELKRKITAGSFGKTIRVWDTESGKEVLLLEGHEKSTLPVSFSPSGDRILSGSLDQSVRLWDVSTGKEIRKMDGHTSNIFSVAFHPSGKYAASASADKTIRLWDLETGEILQTYSGHNGGILDVEFSPDGNHLLSCAVDHMIILWETVTGNKLYSFVDHKATVNDIEFSPDGWSFASASDDKTARLWKIEKKVFLEFYFMNDIENAIAASPLFNAREQGESKQAYKERQDKAATFLDELYNEYYKKYLLMMQSQSIENLKKLK